jgi:dTDP-4-amino-4,6-dideoxygalactose transaminase
VTSLPDCEHVFHQYVIKVKDRSAFQAHMQEAGVGTAIHYPCTIPAQPLYHDMGYSNDNLPVAAALSEEVVSLPVHPALTDADIQTIISAVRAFTPEAVLV